MDYRRGTWLVAVSAGPDSMALLFWCLEQGIHIAAAHFNYHHRPEAEEEEQYVREVCAAHGIDLHVHNSPFSWHGNFEAAARMQRYCFFSRLVRMYGYEGVLIAHQEDDLLETYLMQKEKGITPETYGLAEETVFQDIKVCRPLLDRTKADLETYCRERGIRYYIDQTNFSMEYARNRMRHQVLAGMTAEQKRELKEEIRQANKELQALRDHADRYIHDGTCTLSDYRSLEEEVRLCLLRRIMEPEPPIGASVSTGFLQESDKVLMHHDDFVIPVHGRNLVCRKGTFFLHDRLEPYRFRIDGRDDVKEVCHPLFRIEEGMPGVNALTAAPDDYPLTIRSFQSGDRIRMRFGTKKVNRFFIDRHVPLYLREVWPVVENVRGEIIMVPGLGCDAYHYSEKPDFCVTMVE